MATQEEDEWEYEYHETETEDFFIPLDLANVPGAQVPLVSQGRPGHPTLLKSRLRALNAAQGQPAEFSTDVPLGQETATMGEVQITGLHTTNPLVMYNGQLLSCHWTSSIGTDLFFVKPDASVGDPLRSLPSVDLVSLGSAKLIAKAGELRPRDDLFDNDSDGRPSSGNTLSASNNEETTPNPPNMPSEGQTVNEKEPASFLEKLNSAKAKRGEKSRLATSKTSAGTRLVSEPVRKARVPEDTTNGRL